MAAALGACISSSIVPVLERRGVAIDDVEIRVSKTLATDPKRIAHLVVRIKLAGEVDGTLEKIVLRAASTCAVGRSLASTYEVTVG